jgi:uncharacterized protein YraI
MTVRCKIMSGNHHSFSAKAIYRLFAIGRSFLRQRLGLMVMIGLLLAGVWFGADSAAGASDVIALEQANVGKLAVVGAQGADLYGSPNGVVARSLPAGTTVTAIGRSADNQWILVELDNGGAAGPGWVEAHRLVVFGADQLPVMAAGEAPVATAVASTPAATRAPTEAMTVDATMTTATRSATATPVPATATPTETATPLPTATATDTASPTPSPTPLPTNTPTPLPTNTLTPALVAITQNEVVAIVGAGGTDLLDAPDGAVVQQLALGAALTALGRNGDGEWLYVELSDGRLPATSGWVASSEVVAFNVRGLPVLEADGQPAVVEPTMEPVEIESATITTTEAMTEAVEPLASDLVAPVESPATSAAATPAAALATPRPTPVADGRPTARVAMTGSRLNIRSGPGVEYPIVGKALPNERFVALGRNGAITWVQIEVAEAPDGYGWVSADFVELDQPVVNLPISSEVSESAPPAATPTPLTTSVREAEPTSTQANTSATSAGGRNPPVALTTGASGLSGKLVVQSSPGGTFYLYNLATGAVNPVTGGLDPALSPDGSQIAFVRNDRLYLIDSDGRNERAIFGGRPGLRSPKWSPDGKSIVFSRADGEYKCYDLGFGGLCFSGADLRGMLPSTLPDAIKDQIADRLADESKAVKKPNWMISAVDADGKAYRDLAALNSAEAPDWNSAGIVYQSTAGIQKTEDKNGAQTQPVIVEAYYHDPDWQPGGGRIVFQSRQGGNRWEIYSVNPDGSGLGALTRPKTTLVDQMPSNVAPAWSPDGQHIVFLSNREENGEAGQWRVWVMDADGSNQRPLPLELPINYAFVLEQAVDWSP